MKNTLQSNRKTLLIVSLLLVAVLLLAGGVFLYLRGNNEAPAVPGYFWESLPPQYPELDRSDLMPEAIDLTSDRVFPSLTYGLHTSFWWDEGYRNLGLTHMHLLQFSHIRQKFAWADLEPEYREADDPQRYVWAQADAMMDDISREGIEVVARLDNPPDWAIVSPEDYDHHTPPFDMVRLVDYCGAVASRYTGRIAAYQIWNEPNLAREWGDHSPNPRAYTNLLAECSAAIRAADPDAIIISAGLAPTGTRSPEVMPHEEFLWEMYAAGASQHFDVLGVHAPGYRSPPEADPLELETGDLPWMSFRNVEFFRAIMVANGDAAKQIAIVEMGYTIDPVHPEYAWFAVTPEQQGDYLERAYRYAAEHWRPWVGLMSALYYPNPDWTEEDEEYWWGVGTTAPWPWGLDARPAWWHILRMEKISTNPEYSHPARPE